MARNNKRTKEAKLGTDETGAPKGPSSPIHRPTPGRLSEPGAGASSPLAPGSDLSLCGPVRGEPTPYEPASLPLLGGCSGCTPCLLSLYDGLLAGKTHVHLTSDNEGSIEVGAHLRATRLAAVRGGPRAAVELAARLGIA